MPRSENRSYKKGKPHRDARLFIIVAEGKREDEYFGWFEGKSQRLKVEIVPRDQGASAPSFMLERIENYIRANGVLDGDQIWFVLDVDNWKRKEIEHLISMCEPHTNWRIAISNPCFEVWLHYHADPIEKNLSTTCKELKESLHIRIPGGYHIEKVAKRIREAAHFAALADKTPQHPYPEEGRTKLYLLANEMLQMLGHTWENE